MSHNRVAFVAMPFAAEHHDRFEHVFKPALERAGFLAERGDNLHTTNSITLDIERAILESDLVLCDLTGSNPNVYYELALAHAVRKPVVLVSPTAEELPFDIRHIRTILYDDSARDWKDDLGNAVAETARSAHGASSPLQIIGGALERDSSRAVREVFRLFKSTVSAFSAVGAKFRFHLLTYDSEAEVVSISVQDDVYRDKDFSIGIKDGLGRGIVVCEVVACRHLISRDLPANHSTFYSDSSIPERLSSVMAAPICDESGIRAVVSMDSKLQFEQLGLDVDDLEELFLRLCRTVGRITGYEE